MTPKRFLAALFLMVAVALVVAGCDDDDDCPTCPPDGETSENPAGRIYVPNQADSTLYVYDSKTLQRVDSVDIPIAEPHFVTFSHDYEYFYIVGRQQGGELAKYRSSDNSLVTTVNLTTVADAGVFPTTVMVSGSNDTLFMTNFAINKGRTYRFDVSGTNFAFLDSNLQAGFQTHDMRISPDFKYLVSAGFSSDDITIYNTETGDLQPLTIDSAQPIFNLSQSNNYGPYGVQIDHNSNFAYLACRKGVDQIRIVDLNNLTIVDSIVIPGAGPSGMEGPTYFTLLPDNNTLFVTGMNDNKVWVIRLSTREIIESYEFSVNRPFGIASSDDGSRVYISCTNDRPNNGAVYVIDGTTLEKIDSVTVGSEPFGLSWRPLVAGES